jgi:pimeloyl-ACP methyl ester carboxylesterase
MALSGRTDMTRRYISRTTALLLGLAVAGPLLFAQAPQAIEKRVSAGAYELNFKIISGRGPTILLESGGGMDATEWDALAPRLAQETGATVVAYDRAGFGKSDLPTSKYDLGEDTDALWAALRRLGLDKDLVLVGHSYGGWLIRFEAARHPGAVRGLIFVDPFTVELVDILGLEYCNNHPWMGKLSFDATHPETLTKDQRALARMVGAPGNNLGEKTEVIRKFAVPKGIPVLIVASGTDWFPKPEDQKAWRLSQEKFTASIPGARLVIAEKSDHLIPLREPELLVALVAGVVRSVK